jgi:hypothetical protein
MSDELDRLLKTKKDRTEKVYLSMWLEGGNIKITPQKGETKIQLSVTPKDREVYYLLKAMWDYENR